MTSEGETSAEGSAVPAPLAAPYAAIAPAPPAPGEIMPAVMPGTPPVDGNAVDERTLIELYAGTNAEAYLHTYDRIAGSNYGIASWSWPGLFVPLAWMLYRKLWVPAAWFIFLPITLIYVFEVDSVILYIQVAFATQAKQLYIWQAQKRIARILAVETDPQVIRHKAVQAGGTSATGLAIGGLITLAATLYGFAAAWQN